MGTYYLGPDSIVGSQTRTGVGDGSELNPFSMAELSFVGDGHEVRMLAGLYKLPCDLVWSDGQYIPWGGDVTLDFEDPVTPGTYYGMQFGCQASQVFGDATKAHRIIVENATGMEVSGVDPSGVFTAHAVTMRSMHNSGLDASGAIKIVPGQDTVTLDDVIVEDCQSHAVRLYGTSLNSQQVDIVDCSLTADLYAVKGQINCTINITSSTLAGTSGKVLANSATVNLVNALTASAAAQGSVTPTSASVVYGTDKSFLAVPSEGWQPYQWFVDGALAQTGGMTYILEDIEEPHAITLTFERQQHLCTLADVKQRLGLQADETTHDELLSFIISGMTGVFNRYCRRELLVTAEDLVEFYTGQGPYLQLRRYPIVTITEIKEADDYDFDSADALEVDDDYRMVNMGLTGIIYRAARWSEIPDSNRVTYRGGYCAAGVSPAAGEHALPSDIREAAVMQCTLTFKRRDDIGLSGGSFTGASYSKFADIELLPLVKETLDNYVRRTF